MTAVDPQGGQKYWLNGVPLSDLSQNGTGAEKYWLCGLPARALIPFHTANALLIGSGRGKTRVLAAKGQPAALAGEGRGKTSALSDMGVVAHPVTSGRGEGTAASSSIDSNQYTSAAGQARATCIRGTISQVRTEARTETVAQAIKGGIASARTYERGADTGLADKGGVGYPTGFAGGSTRLGSIKGAFSFTIDSVDTDGTALASYEVRYDRLAKEKYWLNGLPWSGMSSDGAGTQKYWLGGTPLSGLPYPRHQFHLSLSGRGQLQVFGFSRLPLTVKTYGRGQAVATSLKDIPGSTSGSGTGNVKITSYEFPEPSPAEQTYWQGGLPFRGVITDLDRAGRQKYWLSGLPETVIQPKPPVFTNLHLPTRAQIQVRASKDIPGRLRHSGRGNARMFHEFIDPTLNPNRFTFWKRGLPYTFVPYHFTSGIQKYWQVGQAFSPIMVSAPRECTVVDSLRGNQRVTAVKGSIAIVAGTAAGQTNATLIARPIAPTVSGRGGATVSCKKGGAAALGRGGWSVFDSTDAFDAPRPFDGQAVQAIGVMGGRSAEDVTTRTSGPRRVVWGRGQTVVSCTRGTRGIVWTSVKGDGSRAVSAKSTSSSGTAASRPQTGLVGKHGFKINCRGSGRPKLTMRCRARLNPTPADHPGNGPHNHTHELEALDVMCGLGLSGQTVSAILMRALIQHFSDESQIMDPLLHQYRWTPDQATSGIRIASDVAFRPIDAGKFPAIMVKRLPKKSRRVVIGDRTAGDETGRGATDYTRIEQGAHRIYCMAETDGEAEDLANEVFDFLSFMSPVFRERMKFHDFEVVSMGALDTREGMGNRIGVAIEVRYVFESGWTVKPEGPLLKTVALLNS